MFRSDSLRILNSVTNCLGLLMNWKMLLLRSETDCDAK